MRNSPELIREAALRGQLSGGLHAGVLLADIKDFTGRFQEMASRGTLGAEELSREVNATLSAVVSRSAELGGFPVSFGGDAVMVLFPQGIQGALAAVETLKTISRGEILPLSFSTAQGNVTWSIVPMDGWSFYSFQGDALRNAASGEDVSAFEAEEQTRTAAPSSPVSEVFQPYVSQGSQGPGQFRQVTSVFISLENRKDGSCPVEFQQLVLNAAVSTGGFVSGLETSGESYRMLVVFGAPVSREDDHTRADRFMEYVFNGASGRVRAGASSGLVFSGMISTPLLHSYTVLGPSVNLAARLHDSAGWNRVFACSSFNATSMLQERRVRQLELKGFARPVTVHQLHPWGRRKAVAASRSPLFGRTQLLETVCEHLKAGGTTVLLRGETGTGKTRIVEELGRMMAGAGLIHLRCRNASDLSSGDVFGRWFTEWYGGGGEAAFREKLYGFVDMLEGLEEPKAHSAADELLRAESVLAALVGFIREKSLYSGLDPQGRFDNTVSVISAFMTGLMTLRRTILVVDDLQNMDLDSFRMLAAVLAHPSMVRPSVLLLAGEAATGVEGLPGPEPLEITIPPLSRQEAGEFLRWKLNADPSNELLDWFHGVTEGIPFYMEQYASILEAPDRVPGDGELPGNLHSLLVARLDNLQPALRRLVLSASVLGREFQVEVLDRLDSEVPAADLLEEGIRLGIWSRSGSGVYSFSQNLLREAAFRLQSHSHRKDLHGTAAAVMEELWPGDPSRALATARHYELAGLGERASRCYLLAGNHALSRRMRESCVFSFGKVLELSSVPDERLEAYRKLYELHTTSGEQDRAQQVIDAAMADKTVEEHHRGAVGLMRINLAINRGEPEEARKLLEMIEDPHSDLRAEMLHLKGRILMLLGMTDDARDLLLDLYGEFRNGSKEEREIAHRALGNASGCMLRTQSHLPGAERALKTVLDYAAETGRLMMETIAVGNLALLYRYMGGHFEDSGRMIRRHLELARLTGSKLAELQALGNLASHLERKAPTEEVFNLYQEAITLAEQYGGADSLSIAHANLAVALGRVEKYGEAIHHFNRALDICRENGLGIYVKEYLFELAAAQVDAGDLTGAGDSLFRLEESDGEDGEYVQQRLLIRGRILRAEGDVQGAEECFRQSLISSVKDSERFDALYDLAKISRDPEVIAQAVELCRRVVEDNPHWELQQRLEELVSRL